MLLCPLVSAQVLVDARRAAEILQHFEPQAAATLTCDFTPVTPVMTFTYRFQAGYLVRVSLTQFHGPGHWIAVLLRVTPRADESQPVYFLRTFDLPDVPATDFSAEVAGAFLVGEGHYEANAIVFDDSHRACRADWQIEVKGTDRHRIVNLPNSVGPISEAAWWAPTSDAPIARLTVFLHVAPLNARMLNLRASDSVMAVASLMALLERLPARAVRLVVFNLHREKEIYRTEFFTLNDLDEVTRALDGLQLGLVNYQALQHQNEQRQLLRNLIHREVNEPSHSSLVVFLGPDGSYGRENALRATDLPRSDQRFFYLQYRMASAWSEGQQAVRTIDDSGPHPPPPCQAVNTDGCNNPNANQPSTSMAQAVDSLPSSLASDPDVIAGFVRRVRGKVLVVRNASDFAKAVEDITRRLAAGANRH